jgi:hypothetical protein
MSLWGNLVKAEMAKGEKIGKNGANEMISKAE